MKHSMKLRIRTLAFAASALMCSTFPARSFPQQRVLAQQQSREVRAAVSLHNGVLSVSAKSQSLRSMLQQIEEAAKVRIVLAPTLGDEQVSVELQNVRLDEALRQILTAYDAFYLYAVNRENKGTTLKTVWVYPPGGANGVKPVPTEAWASTQELQRSLSDVNPEVRANAISALIKREGARSLEAVLSALTDDASKVRIVALSHALSSNVEIPKSSLIDLALNDKSETVKMLALDALSTDNNQRWVIERLSQDPNSTVSGKATQILHELDAANGAATNSVRTTPENAPQ